MTGLTWHPGEDGIVAAQVGGTTIGVVYPEGWWSSYILGVTRPAADQERGKDALEVEWTVWMDRAGMAWAKPTAACPATAHDPRRRA